MNRQIQDDPIYSQEMDGIKKEIKETNYWANVIDHNCYFNILI